MKISKDIELAKKDYPGMYHVISSNEVHSFETLSEAKIDLLYAIDAELGIGNGFSPVLVPIVSLPNFLRDKTHINAKD